MNRDLYPQPVARAAAAVRHLGGALHGSRAFFIYRDRNDATQPSFIACHPPLSDNAMMDLLGGSELVCQSVSESDEHRIVLGLAAGESFQNAALARELTDLAAQSLGEQPGSASIDDVHGIPDRRAFAEQVDRALESAGDQRIATLVVDVDHFHRVTARFGEAGGEELMRILACRIMTALPPGMLVAGLGGDRLGVMMTVDGGAHAEEAALVAAADVQAVFLKPVCVAQEDIVVTASIGVAVGGSDIRAGQLLRDADLAISLAKRAGGATTRVFRAGMNNQPAFQLLRERDVRMAVSRREFIVFFQPIMNAATGALIGFEALSRWRHPEEGILPPSTFMDVLEETGLIDNVGRQVLREACKQAARWRALTGSLVPISVNVAPLQLRHPDFCDHIAQSLSVSRLPAEALVLELTESTVVEDKARTRATLERLREMGVRVRIDDFGTGYSALAYLHELPVSGIKLDRHWIRSIEASPEQREIVRLIVQMAHQVKMDVVMEGIETGAQLELARTLGCDFAQGFLFARPIDVDQATKFLTTSRKRETGRIAARRAATPVWRERARRVITWGMSPWSGVARVALARIVIALLLAVGISRASLAQSGDPGSLWGALPRASQPAAPASKKPVAKSSIKNSARDTSSTRAVAKADSTSAKPARDTVRALANLDSASGAVAPTSTVADESVARLTTQVARLSATVDSLRSQAAAAAKKSKAPETAPLALHVGDADLLIGGFMDATAVYRSENTGTGIGSSFGTIPFSNSTAGSMAETRFSAQNSRLTLQATSKHDEGSLKGYIEGDFLGNAPVNLNITSNGNTLRMRLYWVQYATAWWDILAGQSWSLLTPGRNLVSPMPGDLFYSQDIDTNYQLGLAWGRTPQFRLTVKPSDVVTAAVSLENPQQYVGSAVVLPAAFPAAEVDVSGSTAVPNQLPDAIAKVAFDPKVGGLHQHIEVAGLYRTFKTYLPSAATAPAATSSASGSGVSANAVLEPIKNFRLVGTVFLSHGGGRYVANVNAPDFIVRADGSISTVAGASFLGGTEFQATPKTLLYSYYSQARFDQDSTTDVGGMKPIGFGLAGTASNRAATEVTVGVTQTFFRAPSVGGLQAMVQYSRVRRTPFAVPAGTPASATVNMFFFNFRYVLP